MVKIKDLVWDDWNRSHISRHGVSEQEVEEVCAGKYRNQPTYGNRHLIFGRTKHDRLLTIVLAREKPDIYYVVTARDMSRRERRRFIK